MEQQRKDEILRLAAIYLNDLESLRHDAGWHGDSEIGRWTEIGILPPPKHRFVDSNAKAIYESGFLGAPHRRLPDAKVMVAAIAKRGEQYRDALLSQVYYAHDFLDPADHRVKRFTNIHRAFYVNQPLRTYERNLKRALELADDALLILELRKEFSDEAA